MLESEHALALSDAYPVVDGHTLIVPRKHVGTINELTMLEQKAIWELRGQVRKRLLTSLKPSGFSTRLNDTMEDGDIAGHACVHVVPRHREDNLELPYGIEWATDDHVTNLEAIADATRGRRANRVPGEAATPAG